MTLEAAVDVRFRLSVGAGFSGLVILHHQVRAIGEGFVRPGLRLLPYMEAFQALVSLFD